MPVVLVPSRTSQARAQNTLRGTGHACSRHIEVSPDHARGLLHPTLNEQIDAVGRRLPGLTPLADAYLVEQQRQPANDDCGHTDPAQYVCGVVVPGYHQRTPHGTSHSQR